MFLAVLVTLILVETFRPGSIVIYQAVGILLGLLFIPLGNMMGKVKSNFFIGIRTPWALSDPDVWNRTQRMGGFLLFLSGLISILGAFLLPEKLYFLVLMAFLLGGMGLTAVMSYLWYRRKQAQ